jgi:hypothetical protein
VGEAAREAARWRLAKRLYDEMERLDPSPDTPEWETMPDFERRFYYHCITAILTERATVLMACE